MFIHKKPLKKYSNVMLIDDSELDNFINAKMIECSHFAEKVFIHTGSKSALEFLKNIEQAGEKSAILLPEIIFLDINMPFMDGLQFLAEFEKLNRNIFSPCKIHILSSSNNPDEIDQVKKSGYVKGVIQKPLSENILSKL